MTTTDPARHRLGSPPPVSLDDVPAEGHGTCLDTAPVGRVSNPDPPTAVPPRSTGPVLLVAGLVGATVALVLLIEKLALIADPDYIPSCSVDAVLSCGSIMRTAQSAVLGFPNPILGLIGFPIVVTLGALLTSGAALPRWCWVALQIAVTAATTFVAWLIVQSLAVIGALCPYCMVVWVATVAIFWHVTATNLRLGVLAAGRPGQVVGRHPAAATVTTCLLVLGGVVAAFPAWFISLLAG